jgi:response regulator PhyR-like protein
MGETTVKEASPEFRAALVDCIPHLRAFARSLTRNRDRADDLVHDAAVRALVATHRFTPGTNFKAMQPAAGGQMLTYEVSSMTDFDATKSKAQSVCRSHYAVTTQIVRSPS